MQNLGHGGIEKGLRQLRLLVVNQVGHKTGLNLGPHRFTHQQRTIVATQQVNRLFHTLIVEIDTVASQLLNQMPVAFLEKLLGLLSTVAKQPVVFVEARQNITGHFFGQLALFLLTQVAGFAEFTKILFQGFQVQGHAAHKLASLHMMNHRFYEIPFPFAQENPKPART